MRIHLCLIGSMGSGKTTLGKLLADKINKPFIDLDEYIESYTGMSIVNIFDRYGEERFRLIEKNVMSDLLKNSVPSIISLGGGTPCFFDNLEIINKYAHAVYLQVSPEELSYRLTKNTSTRPLLKGKSQKDIELSISRLLTDREEYYLQADLVLQNESASNTLNLLTRYYYENIH